MGIRSEIGKSLKSNEYLIGGNFYILKTESDSRLRRLDSKGEIKMVTNLRSNVFEMLGFVRKAVLM